MITVTVVQSDDGPIDDGPIDIAARLKVWRERWHYAPTTDARAHAQVAIDYWLDRLLEVDVRRAADVLPTQRAIVEVVDPVNA